MAHDDQNPNGHEQGQQPPLPPQQPPYGQQPGQPTGQPANQPGNEPGNQPFGQQPPYGQGQPPAQQPPYGQPQGQPVYGAPTPGQQGPGQQAPYGQPAPGQQNPGQQTPGQQIPGQQAPYGQPTPGQQPNAAGQYPQQGGAGYAGGQFPPGPQGPQKQRMDPKKKKKVLLLSIIAAAVVLLLAIGGIVAAVVVGANSGPEATVRNYLQAISQGKASEANKLVDTGLNEEESVLLTDDVLRESSEFISKPKVGRVSSRGDSAYVAISYVLDGTTYDETLNLSKADGGWTVDRPLLATMYMYSSTNTKASVNGTTVDFTDEGSLAAYPAVYEVGAPEGDFFEAEAQTAVLGTGSKADYDGIELELKPTKALTDAVQKEVNAHLDECVTSTETDPEGCDLRIPSYLDFTSVQSVAYKVNTYPTVTVDETGRYFESADGDVGASVTGTKYDGSTGTVEYGSDSWGPSGKLEIDGDKVKVEYY